MSGFPIQLSSWKVQRHYSAGHYGAFTFFSQFPYQVELTRKWLLKMPLAFNLFLMIFLRFSLQSTEKIMIGVAHSDFTYVLSYC